MMTMHFLLMIFFLIHSSSYQQQSQLYQSAIYLTAFGTAFQPHHQIELLSTLSYIRSLIYCSTQCNQNCQCRTFDYDQISRICRLFEGEFSTGTVITNSTFISSRIGAIRYNTSLTLQSFSSYNQTCDQCGTGQNRYLQCVNNTCQCPLNTYWNGQICLNQLYNGSNCSHTFSLPCRQDLNLTCSKQTNTCTDSVCQTFGFQPPVPYTTGLGPQSIIAADFNKDNHLDLVVTNYNGDTVSLFFGMGNGSFQVPAISFDNNGTNPYWLVAEDFNNDGNLDLAICNEGSDTVAILFGQSNGSFQLPAKTFASGGFSPSSLVATDVNNDNKTDLIVVNTASNNIAVFLNLGNGTFQVPGQIYAAGSLTSSITNGDFNADGYMDLAVVSRGSDQLLIFFGLGNGSFNSNATSYNTGRVPYNVQTADFDNDDILDLVVANFNNATINIFFGMNNGTFVAPLIMATYYTGGAGPIALAVQDLNGDLKMDIAVSNQVGNNFIVYLGNGDRTFVQNKTYSSNGQKLQGIIAADFNEDGNYDLAITNQDNNTLAILLTQCT